MYTIYVVACSVTSMEYVGVTGLRLSRRWTKHLTSARTGVEGLLYDAIRKYGEDNFTIEVLATFESKEDADDAERTAIIELGTLSPNGYNKSIGNLHTEEWKENTRKSYGSRKLLFAKISEDDVRAIRAKYEEGHSSYGDLAEQYGLSNSGIAKIIQRKNWRDVL